MGWDVGSPDTVYESVFLDINPPEFEPEFVQWKTDGTKVYFGGIDTDRIHQYSCSTAWDVSTATSDSKSFLFSGQDSRPYEVVWKPDGTKLWMLGNTNNRWYAYTASTPWDVSTLSYDSVSFAPTLGVGEGISSIAFKSDGTKAFTLDLPDKIRSYSLSTPWDISTASYDSVVYTTAETLLRGFAVKPDGTRLYTVGSGGDSVTQYDLSTGWDLSTITGSSGTFNIGSEESASRALVFKDDDGSKMWVAGFTNQTIYQYTVGGAGRGLVLGSITLN